VNWFSAPDSLYRELITIRFSECKANFKKEVVSGWQCQYTMRTDTIKYVMAVISVLVSIISFANGFGTHIRSL
jgi:predicted polyphosphate/ATP-dependent NAD kinase